MSVRTKLADPPADPEVRRLRSAIGAHVRNGNPEGAAEVRRELDVRRLAAHIRQVIDTWPALTAADRDELAQMLRPGAEAVAHGT